MARAWVIGENRYVYTYVYTAAGDTLTISSANYTVYDTSDESTIASGVATIQNQYIYSLWAPTETGIYVVDFDYVIGSETFTARQVIEARETLS